ncbi:phospholipase effector Tle1 domain-containing protein [Janthinobacterium lividum]
MSIIYTGRKAPLDGRRRLTAKESSQRAKAMACVRSPHKTECQGQVYIGLFYDGSGNNAAWRQVDPVVNPKNLTQRQRNKHSNVAKLWDAHLEQERNGYFSVYMPGVGTPFAAIGDTISTLTDNAGGGFGFMGADRINWGITSLFNAVHSYLTGSNLIESDAQRVLVNLMSSQMLLGKEGVRRWTMLTALEERLAKVVKTHQRKVKQINVSIFGFSRGAAEARASAHWLHQIFERENGAFELAGVPIRIGFLGIFDTVAAVGVGDVTPVTFGHMAWGDGTQSIHPVVEECAHFIALHEQRASFPLESATGRGNVGYPGMHSDVGGGYYPGEQGRSMPAWGPSPHLSQIPLIDMHFAALKAGVPLLTINEMNEKQRVAVRKSFSTDPRLIASYNNWLTHNGIKGADVKTFTEAHTKQYLRWRGMLHAQGKTQLKTKRFFKESDKPGQKDLLEADTDLGIYLRSWRERKKANATVAGWLNERAKTVLNRVSPAGMLFVEDGKDPLSDWEERFLKIMTEGAQPPAGCVTLFEDYVHDSRAGFRILGKHEPVWLTGGYGRFRNVFVQSDDYSNMSNIANESLKAVKAAGDAAVTYFQKLYGYTVSTYRAARRKVAATAKAVAEAEKRLERQAVATYRETSRMIVDGATRAGHGVHDAGVEAEKKLDRAVKTAKNAMQQASQEARLYYQAEKKVILKYAKAEAEWKAQLEKRWREEEREKAK